MGGGGRQERDLSRARRGSRLKRKSEQPLLPNAHHRRQHTISSPAHHQQQPSLLPNPPCSAQHPSTTAKAKQTYLLPAFSRSSSMPRESRRAHPSCTLLVLTDFPLSYSPTSSSSCRVPRCRRQAVCEGRTLARRHRPRPHPERRDEVAAAQGHASLQELVRVGPCSPSRAISLLSSSRKLPRAIQQALTRRIRSHAPPSPSPSPFLSPPSHPLPRSPLCPSQRRPSSDQPDPKQAQSKSPPLASRRLRRNIRP